MTSCQPNLNLSLTKSLGRRAIVVLAQQGQKQSKIILLENKSLVTDTLTVAYTCTFNNYFSEVAVTEGMDKTTDNFANHPSIKLNTEKCNNKVCFGFNTVSESYINGILVMLNPRQAVGCDLISQRLLRSSPPALMQPLTKLINYFITNRLWPTKWKSSNLTPVFKKAGGTNKTCYRPVYVLPALSKIYKRVVADQVYFAFAPSLLPNLSVILREIPVVLRC